MSNSFKIIKRYIKYILSEGVNDPYNNKLVLFMGPPGAGKSTIINTLKSLGLKHSTPDDFLEHSINKKYIQTNRADSQADALSKFSDDILSNDSNSHRSLSLRRATKRLNIWFENQLGIIMEGSGSYPDWYQNEIIDVYGENYDIIIIMLYEDLDICLERNEKRGNEGGRSLPDSIVKQAHQGFIDNYNDFKSLADNNPGSEFITICGDESYNEVLIDQVDRKKGLALIRAALNR